MSRTTLPIPAFTLILLLATVLGGCRGEESLATDPPPQPVRTAPAELGPFVPRVLLHGVVRAGTSAEIVAAADGEIGYPPRFPGGLRSGERVRRGEVLARIADGRTGHELREARLQDESSRFELERHRRAFEAGVESEARLAPYRVAARLAEERLAAAEEALARLTLRSPVDGRLEVAAPIPEGAQVRREAVLARVVGEGPLRVEALVAAGELESLEPGLPARFLPPDGEVPVGEGRVAEVPPALGPAGVASVILEVTADRGMPRPGAGVEVEVELGRRGLAVTIPDEAVLLSRGGASVFVLGRKHGSEAPVARRRAVRLGSRDAERVEVLEGLQAGERVVVSGAGFLADDQPVSEVPAPATVGGQEGAGP